MMKRPTPTPPFVCPSCRRGHAMIRIHAKEFPKLLRCAWCGHQSTPDQAIEAAKETAERRVS